MNKNNPIHRNHQNRREFVHTCAVGTAGISISGVGFSAKSYAAITGANDRIRVAVIGVRNQGTVHLKSWCELKDSHNVQVIAICDTDEALFAPALKFVEEKSGAKPTTNWDLRAILPRHSDFSRRCPCGDRSIDVAVSCRPAGVKPNGSDCIRNAVFDA